VLPQEQPSSLALHRLKEAQMPESASLPKTITEISSSFLFLLYKLKDGFNRGLGFVFLI
jgi:hypothetical protein